MRKKPPDEPRARLVGGFFSQIFSSIFRLFSINPSFNFTIFSQPLKFRKSSPPAHFQIFCKHSDTIATNTLLHTSSDLKSDREIQSLFYVFWVHRLRIFNCLTCTASVAPIEASPLEMRFNLFITALIRTLSRALSHQNSFVTTCQSAPFNGR